MYNIKYELCLDKNPMIGDLGHQTILAEAQRMLKMLELYNESEKKGYELADIYMEEKSCVKNEIKTGREKYYFHIVIK